MDYSKIIGKLGGETALQNAVNAGTTTGLAGLSAAAGAAMPILGLAQVAGSALESLTSGIAGNKHSGVGDALGSVPIVGGFLGNVTNSLFGSDIDEGLAGAYENAANAVGGMEFNTSSTAGFLGDFGDRKAFGTVSAGDIGEDGLFSNKAGARASQINALQDEATKRMYGNAQASVNEMNRMNAASVLRNYMALGGHITRKGMNDARKKYLASLGRETGSLVMRKGGGLRLCGMFSEGGNLNTHGLEFNSGLTKIDEGGSHEQNPNGGIFMGIAPDGKPNLVEEGESIWNDYVFSDRTKVPESLRKKYSLPKDSTFSDAAKRFIDEERPNDPIARRTSDMILSELKFEQEMIRAKKQRKAAEEYAGAALADNLLQGLAQGFADGGYMFDDGGTKTPVPYRYEEDDVDTAKPFFSWLPNQLAIARYQSTRPNKMVDLWTHSAVQDEGTPVIGSITPAGTPVVSTPATKVSSRSTAGTSATTSQARRRYDRIEPASQAVRNQVVRNETLTNPYGPRVAQEAYLGTDNEDIFPIDRITPYFRYAPLVGAGAAAISGFTDRPDTSLADRMIDAAGRLGTHVTVPTERISSYRVRRPYDERYAVNLANQNYRQALRNIGNVSGGNRAMQLSTAGLAGYNNQLQLGEILRSSYLANRADDAQVAEFNRATDLANAQTANASALAEAQLNASRDAQYVEALDRGLAAKEALLESDYGSRYLDLTNLFNNFGALGREAVSDNMLKSLANAHVLDYAMDNLGNVKFRAANNAKGGQLKKRRF